MANTRSYSKRLFSSEETASTASATFDITNMKYLGIQAVATETCLCAAAMTSACDICATCDIFTEATHGFLTGLKGQFTTSCALPTGLCTCTDYFIIRLDGCTFKVATSRANAVAGTPINITDTGTGTQTFTATCADCTSATITVTYSNCTGECAVYAADTGIGLFSTPAAVTGSGLSTIDAETGAIPYKSLKVELDVTDSQWSFTIDLNGKD